MAVLYSSSDALMPGWQEEQRNVGPQDHTVFMRAASHQVVLSSLLQRMQALQTQVDTNALLLGRPRLCNVAAQVLLYALGDKLRTMTSRRFFAAAGAANLKTAVSDLDIVHQADAVITRRNNEHEHFPNLAALEHEVGVCVQLMDANPTMRQACRWECWVLDNWDAFKAARPIVD